MKKIQLGQTNEQVSNIAFGVMRINNLDAKSATEMIELTASLGMNFYDNADIYGNGECEKIFGQALKNSSLKREDAWIQTKCGIVPGISYDFSKEHILKSVDESLQRLGVDYVDSLLLHRPDTLMEPEEVAEAFTTLEKAGKVRYFGVSNQKPMQIELLKTAVKQPLVANQLQFGIKHTEMIDSGIHVNMSDARSIDHEGSILEYSRIHKMTIQAWSPYQYGFFDGIFIDNPKFEELNQLLQEMADKYHVTKNGIATAFILRHPAKMQTIVGTMNKGRIQEIAAASEIVLSREDWYKIYLAAGNDLP